MRTKLAIRNAERLKAAHVSGLLDMRDGEVFGQLTRLVCRCLNTPIAFVSMIGMDRQIFLGQMGFPDILAQTGYIPVEQAICRHIVARDKGLIIDDMTQSRLTRDNKSLRDYKVESYIGMPLRSNGHIVGSLCALDVKTRAWTHGDAETMQQLARFAMLEIAAQKHSPLSSFNASAIR